MADTLRDAVAVGDILRTSWPVRFDHHLPLYLGSGRCGASFDAWGLLHGSPTKGPTALMHADHWHRGAFGLDYWLPVARLRWAGVEPSPPVAYRQELRLHDACLETRLVWPDRTVRFRAWFHPGDPDVLAVEVSHETAAGGTMPRLLLAPEADVRTHYNQSLEGSFETLESESAFWLARVVAGTADSVVGLRLVPADGEARLVPTEEGVAVDFPAPRGRHLLLVGVAGSSRRAELVHAMRRVVCAEQHAADATQAWHRRWGDAFVRVPVPEYQAMWARSLYYVLCSYAPEVRSPAAPMGWSGYGWPFHFPQDVSYIHPALLRLGHWDIARSWVEFYRGQLDRTLELTRRIYRTEGAMWAWEHPIGPDSEMLQEGTPNWFQYEIHNAAYPLRMAYETSQYLQDEAWTRDVAWPIVVASARFYGSALRREDDGSWGLRIVPSMGQDEHGGRDARNYLCALFSARYSLAVATRMARQLGVESAELAGWRRILAEGLAFRRLLLPREGYYATCEGPLGARMLGKQKHPVQINPIVFLPLDAPNEPVVQAYRNRYAICVEPGGNHFAGWTLAAFWLASAHMGDGDGLLEGLAKALPSRYVDPDWIQIYESSGGAPLYVTSHGLYLQALNDAFVFNRWDGVKIGEACPSSWREASFSNLRVPGDCLSGERDGDRWAVRTRRTP